jgi:mRNA (2'-O-methyladenosine-N6-)-methyltransferase
MSESSDALTVFASTALHDLLSSHKITPPISSSDLLIKLITWLPSNALTTSSTSTHRASFRLTDLSRLESILHALAQHWEYGRLFLSNDAHGRLLLSDALLGATSDTAARPRKRKRPVDEDADSAAGAEEDADISAEHEDETRPLPPLSRLSDEMKEVYALLQKSTAKGRLLAERVRLSVFHCTQLF